MRLRTGLALLALAAVPMGGAPAHADTTVEWPAYANIVVTSSPRSDQPPSYQVTTLRANGNGSLDDTIAISPRLSCQQVFKPQQSFTVSCAPTVNPPDIDLGTGEVVNRAWRCVNAAVRADINGVAPNEAVTGTIKCGQEPAVGASCTATANTPNGLANWTGTCVQRAPNGPLPITCTVDLTRVFLDNWQVTCYSTDP